ncbi:response regulator transcription factor [Tenacibaculum tangerinum]|uniref:Response regulator transcription factor n=1 Tax=Tenacibaculum tangerinum TaxID=3038772 RepID=A0ABY8L1H7_9FLAO|nr:response regulator transcription factor [Tenacibaculum tangerinum]WGH75220.1 response regulator transcription factor [Tenacibaculum tangerinum]
MKVFLVDDHPVVIEGYKVLLKASGITVVGSSTDGHGLIDWLENNYCDVLLLDISMPYFNGLDVLKYLQKKESSVKTIMVTSYCEAAIIQKVIELGAKGYVLKDESASCIVDAIKAVYNGKTYFSELARDAIIDMQLETKEEVLITDVLSKKETEVLKLLVEGFNTDDICSQMEIKPSTFRTYKERIRKNLGVNGDIQMALVAIKHKTRLFMSKK